MFVHLQEGKELNTELGENMIPYTWGMLDNPVFVMVLAFPRDCRIARPV